MTTPVDSSAVVDLLGALAYAELTAFDRLAEDARMAPTLTGRAALAKMAAAEITHHCRLVERLEELGAVSRALEAVLVGGAQMFSFGKAGAGRLDVGARNHEATREALDLARIPVVADAVGGNTGRTVRVVVEDPRVIVKEAGAGEHELYRAAGSGGRA